MTHVTLGYNYGGPVRFPFAVDRNREGKTLTMVHVDPIDVGDEITVSHLDTTFIVDEVIETRKAKGDYSKYESHPMWTRLLVH